VAFVDMVVERESVVHLVAYGFCAQA